MDTDAIWKTSRMAALVVAASFAVIGCDAAANDGDADEAAEEHAHEGEDHHHEAGDHADEGDHHDEEGHHGHEEEEGHGHAEGVHLGDVMYELARRFSAIWFAGDAGNAEMVDYQIHEIEEMVGELEEEQPMEAGVDVHSRLETDVLGGLEEVEQAVESGDQEAFEESYRSTMTSCNACHGDTEHSYITVEKPQYNPYPNLDLAGPQEDQ